MIYHMVYLCEWSMCAWEECVLCFYGVDCSIAWLLGLVDLVSFKSSCTCWSPAWLCSIHFWKWDTEGSNQYCWIVCFSLQSVNFCFRIVETLLLGAYMHVSVISYWWVDPFIIIKWSLLFLVTYFCFKVCFV